MHCLSNLIKSCLPNLECKKNNYIEMKKIDLKKHLLSDDVMHR